MTWIGHDPRDLLRYADIAETAKGNLERCRDDLWKLHGEAPEVVQPLVAGLNDGISDCCGMLRDIWEAIALTPEGREAARREQPRESWR